MPKNFLGEHFCVPEKFWYRKLIGTREGAKITSSRQFFLSHIAKTFVGEHFSVSLISGIDNFLPSEG